jgi:hypothetical protein
MYSFWYKNILRHLALKSFTLDFSSYSRVFWNFVGKSLLELAGMDDAKLSSKHEP